MLTISEPAKELHRRAAPSVRGNITTQSVQLQGEIPEEGRKNTKNTHEYLLYHKHFRWAGYPETSWLTYEMKQYLISGKTILA